MTLALFKAADMSQLGETQLIVLFNQEGGRKKQRETEKNGDPFFHFSFFLSR